MATTRHHIEITKIDENENSFILYPKNTLIDVYTTPTSGVTIEGKVNFQGMCNTAASTIQKTVNISGFSLVAGAHVTIFFTNGISVANATLNINSIGAKPIQFEGVALKANAVRAQARVHMVYDGSVFHIISGASNAAYLINSNNTKFFLVGTPTDEAGSPATEHYDTGVYVSANSGELVATKFVGDGSSLTNLNAANISSGVLSSSRLETSGVIAGTYGPSSDTVLSSNNTFTVPKLTTDAYGRVTFAENITYTLPSISEGGSSGSVTSSVANTTKFYLVGSESDSTTTGTLLKDTGVYVSSTSGQLVASTMRSNTYYLGGTSSYIDSSYYTGTSYSVSSISEFLVDSCSYSSAYGVTNKGLTANQGYWLQDSIYDLSYDVSSVSSEVSSLSSSVSSLSGDVSSLSSGFNSLTVHLDIHLSFLDDAVDSLSSEISSLGTDVGCLSGSVNSINSELSSLISDVSSLGSNVATEFASIESRLSYLESRL